MAFNNRSLSIHVLPYPAANLIFSSSCRGRMKRKEWHSSTISAHSTPTDREKAASRMESISSIEKRMAWCCSGKRPLQAAREVKPPTSIRNHGLIRETLGPPDCLSFFALSTTISWPGLWADPETPAYRNTKGNRYSCASESGDYDC